MRVSVEHWHSTKSLAEMFPDRDPRTLALAMERAAGDESRAAEMLLDGFSRVHGVLELTRGVQIESHAEWEQIVRTGRPCASHAAHATHATGVQRESEGGSCSGTAPARAAAARAMRSS